MTHDHERFEYLGVRIQKIDFDTVFKVYPDEQDGDTEDDRSDILTTVPYLHAPTAWIEVDDDGNDTGERDIWLDSPDWTALTGMTGQHGYNGAVMHPSEFIGCGIAQELVRLCETGDEQYPYEPQAFVVVAVGVMNEAGTSDDVAGWAILQHTPKEDS